MSRYQTLLEIVRDEKPKHLVEIGTWSGKRAIELMAVSNCYYTGFDLFEYANDETDEREFNVKAHYEMVDVAKSIEQAGFSKFALIRGDTNTTLWEWDGEPFDFCWIDGGHSVTTIENDFKWASENISEGGTIILDDFYQPKLEGLGCNFLEDRGEVLRGVDKTSRGFVHLLRVNF